MKKTLLSQYPAIKVNGICVVSALVVATALVWAPRPVSASAHPSHRVSPAPPASVLNAAEAGPSPGGDPRGWAVDAARNEASVIDHKGTLLRYRLHMIDAKGDVERDSIESADGTVHRLVRRNQQPLSAEEDQEEQARLNEELNSPDYFARHVKHEQSDKKMAADLIRQLPDAMLYVYAPGQPPRTAGVHGENSDVVLDFKPNPAWNPPNFSSGALTGLQGRMWIDRKTHRLTRFEGDIFRPVNFGMGMLAHVFPGGKLSAEQSNFGERLIVTRFSQHMVVRALMVKTMHVDSQGEASNVSEVKPMKYQDAIRLLLATPLPR